MIGVTVRDSRGQTVAIRHGTGPSLMEAAVAIGLEGIEAQCYGAGICATCHVYVDEAWLQALSEKSEWEQEMLDALSLVQPTSRLACQVRLEAAIDGAHFIVPVRQEAID